MNRLHSQDHSHSNMGKPFRNIVRCLDFYVVRNWNIADPFLCCYSNPLFFDDISQFNPENLFNIFKHTKLYQVESISNLLNQSNEKLKYYFSTDLRFRVV